MTGERAEIEEKAERAMRHLKFEVRDENGRWVEVSEGDIEEGESES